MIAERVFRIYWGPTLENTLDFTYPVVGSNPINWRAPRDGSTFLSNGAALVSWVTGRYYRLQVMAQYFANAQWDGGNGLQAFMDWAMDSNAFTLVPNILTPTLTVSGCYLEGPFNSPQINLEHDATQTIQLTILHPTVDLGLAWRGLFFEYAAGGSLTDPLDYIYSRTSIGYEVNNQGYLNQNAAGTLCDGNYPSPLGNGVQTTLLEPAVTNDLTFPEDLTNAAWSKNLGSVTANAGKAPDQNMTADLFVEDNTVSAIHAISQSITVTAGDAQTGLVFIRPGGRFQALVGFNDAANGAGANKAFVQIDMHAGTAVAVTLGTGTVAAFTFTPLANGWYCLWLRAVVGVAATFFAVRLGDGSGNFTYSGDATSGMYVWGGTAVHGVNNFVASYTPTTSAKDKLQAPLPAAIVPTVPLFVYIKAIEAGAVLAAAAQFPALITLGAFGAAPNWRTIIDVNNGTANRYSVNEGNSGGSVTSSAPASPTVGQLFELLILRFADNSVQIIISVAGGADQPGTRSAAITPGANAYQTTTIDFADGTGVGYGSDVHQIAQVKIGPLLLSGPGSVTTLAQARAT